ncbi:hypothetical protein L1987_70312 [Smallanthus sonchifolius]|uniref:Uncharacterized protein n=1 Tax=Smallanthus sonchifolius TaxID=185202 RepID=A0ACB9APU0_9ASTR|nr:hypothetical protein L1987_70312 [Smallanthus sonchifolius]
MAEETHRHHHHHHHNMITTTELPPDLILFNILPRLPAKTAVRFKSVCKQWRSFLNTRTFYNLHHHHVTTNPHQNNHKLLLLSIPTQYNFFTIDCDAPDEGFTTLTLPFEACDPDNMSILASCNGMICIGMKKRSYAVDEYADLILWNPLTSEYKTLSKTNSNRECYEKSCSCDGFTMYYTSSQDDYRLLRVTKSSNAYIYSLKSDSWRKIESKGSNWNFYQWMPSVLLDEKVYFLNQRRTKVWIIRFDTKTEKFTKIANPSFRKQKPAFWKSWSFSVERGCIQLYLRNSNDGRIYLWRMNGDGDWSNVEMTYLPKPSLNYYLSPLHLMRNGNWIMHFGCFLYNVDTEKYVNGDEFDPLNAFGLFIDEKGKYFETLVSPNRYM